MAKMSTLNICTQQENNFISMKYLGSHKPHFVLEMFLFVEFLKVFSYCVDSGGIEATGG